MDRPPISSLWLGDGLLAQLARGILPTLLCDNCGSLPATRTLPPNLAVCPDCALSTLEHTARLRPYLAEVNPWLAGQGLRFGGLRLRLELRTAEQMRALGAGARNLGVTIRQRESLAGHTIRQRVVLVALLRGLPDALARSVLLHELGHAWLGVRQAGGLPGWQEEGFCELVAHRHLLSLPDAACRWQARRISASTQPVYSEGFHKVKRAAERVGWPALLQAVVRPWRENESGGLAAC